MSGIRAISKDYFLPLIVLLVVILLATLPQYAPPYVVILFISIFMYITLGLSWTAFCGPSNYISLATSAFFGVGVYTSSMLQTLPLPLLILIAGSLSSIFSLLVGLTTLRLRGMYFCIFTFGLSELFRHAVMWYEVNITGTVGRWLPLLNYVTVFYYMLVITLITFLTVYFLTRSKWGLALRSIGENEEASVHAGVNVNAVKIFIFAITSFFMGAAGAVMATRWSYIDPDLAFNPFVTFFTVMMVLTGGIGSPIYGPILGATLLTVLSDTILAEFPRQTMLLFGIILILVIVFLPNGLVSLVKRRGKSVTLGGVKIGSGGNF